MLYFPTHINIETSSACNRSCGFCPVPRPKTTELLDMALLEKLLLELRSAPHRLKVALHWGDEPLANPEFLQYIALCQKLLPQATWLLQTNGDGVDCDNWPILQKSFSAIVVNLYSKRDQTRWAKQKLAYQAAAFPERIQHPGRLRPAKPSRGLPRRRQQAIVHVNHKYQHTDWVEQYQPGVSSRPCTRLFYDAALGYDGKIYLCCRDNIRRQPAGDLAANTLFECYNSPLAQQLRLEMQKGRRQNIAMCHSCPVGRISEAMVLRPEQLQGAQRSGQHRAASTEEPTPSVVATFLQQQRRAADQRLQPGELPWGSYDYWTARNLAREAGHLALPAFPPNRYEYVVGLSQQLAHSIKQIVLEELASALVAIWICGGRVMTREHLLRIDPSVFAGVGSGTLPPHRKQRLREYGTDPRLSSDLDLKILVRSGSINPSTAEDLEHRLGQALEAQSPFIPLSGHRSPRHRLLQVDTDSPTAHQAFLQYNQNRQNLQGKGPHSLQAAVLLLDNTQDQTPPDPRQQIKQMLRTKTEDTTVDIDSLKLPPDFPQVDQLTSEHNGLMVHQLVGALIDFPQLEPDGITLQNDNVVVTGASAVWAAKNAGRTTVRARRCSP